jgi:hypothetical protein
MSHICGAHVEPVWCFLVAYFLICGVLVVLLKLIRIIGTYRESSICGAFEGVWRGKVKKFFSFTLK